MKLAGQREVVIFSTSTCCMCRTVARLFRDLGANRRWWSWTRLLGRAGGVHWRPARRIHGQGHVPSPQREGRLVPLLRNAGAVWVYCAGDGFVDACAVDSGELCTVARMQRRMVANL
ncbi:hypothetical protein ZWY2020_029821 [Hordeum vulgare]|nr:hypothetical protein ZWY2020_029821 [Hordeum vulgare]